MRTYDLIVIGSGPAGQRAAIQGAKSGHRVVLVEQTGNCRRRLRQHRNHPQQDDAGSRAAPLRLRIPGHLRHQLSRQGKDHHGGSGLPRQPGDQDGIGRHAGATRAQWRRGDHRQGQLSRATQVRVENARGQADLEGQSGHHRHRHQAGRFPHRADQRPQHPQQRPDSLDAGNSARP